MGIEALGRIVQQFAQDVDQQATHETSAARPVDGSRVTSLEARDLPTSNTPSSSVSSGPAADARTASQPSASGYSDEQANALCELEQDPAFMHLQEELQAAQVYLSHGAFSELERKWGKGGTDGKLSWGDIEWAVGGRDRCTSSDALALADYLFSHEAVFDAIDKNHNGEITMSEVNAYVQGKKEQIFARRKEALAGVDAPDEAKRPSSEPEPSEETKADDPVPASPSLDYEPFVSSETDPGRRMADAIGHLQDGIDELYASMTDQTSPADMQKIQGEIAKRQSMMQLLMSAAQQQQQMLSNMAKMWSDMAMAAIRNMH